MALAGLVACSTGPMQPVAIDSSTDACAECRMLLSDPRLAAQIVSPGEEPRVFDEIGCLRAHLKTHPVARGAAIYVADHRTGSWLAAGTAMYTRTTAGVTPMASGILAHANAASRDQDLAAAGGQELPVSDILPLAATGEVPQ
jgi:copper chaperone NosL